jgi:hypothetical protein
MKDTSFGQLIFLSLVPSALLLDVSIGRVARELWWTNQESSPVDIIPPRFSMLIYHLGMNNRPQVGDVVSPFDMMIMIIPIN